MGVSEKSLKNLQQKGRPKGSKNKFTELKQEFLKAFDDIGGVKELARWAKENDNNQGMFYKMIVSIIPKEDTINVEGLTPKDIRYTLDEMNASMSDNESTT